MSVPMYLLQPLIHTVHVVLMLARKYSNLIPFRILHQANIASVDESNKRRKKEQFIYQLLVQSCATLNVLNNIYTVKIHVPIDVKCHNNGELTVHHSLHSQLSSSFGDF